MKIAPLAEAPFGAAVNDIGDAAGAAGTLASALHDHGVLLLRGAAIDESRLVALGSLLGPLDLVHPASHRLEGHEHIRLQTNVPGLGVNGGGMYWHADGPWKPEPGATLLRCIEAPSSSGATLFADMRLAWEALEEQSQQQLRGLDGWFPIRETYLKQCRDTGEPPDEHRLATLQDLRHPLVRRHPVTGRESLYLNEAGLERLVGVDLSEGEAILSRLYSHCGADRFVYRHEWLVGDVVMWDNAAVMHKAEQSATTSRKITQRVTTDGFHAHG